ncbi:unnamed protein product [Notodromas monacha]|uniref:Importin N-terminal domain-containing protein n=1 Tax=Notodromas monacha TaxID=399045 RepID=A0A7R9G8C5_9CRUS|nr:unnamed protein product [Notodromas monacha]CAG0913134.1 unnamed protein product [Notodromas monacha]
MREADPRLNRRFLTCRTNYSFAYPALEAGTSPPGLMQFEQIPPEDRSKYEKLDNDLLDSSEDESERSVPRKRESDDSDSIGSATDLQIRDEEDFPLGSHEAEIVTNPGSSVYHAECESMATHDGASSRYQQKRKLNKNHQRAGVGSYTAVQEKDVSGDVFFVGPEYGERPLLAYDELSSPEGSVKQTGSDGADSDNSSDVEENASSGLRGFPRRLRKLKDSSQALPNHHSGDAEEEVDVFGKAPFKIPGPPAVLKRNRLPKKIKDSPLLPIATATPAAITGAGGGGGGKLETVAVVVATAVTNNPAAAAPMPGAAAAAVALNNLWPGLEDAFGDVPFQSMPSMPSKEKFPGVPPHKDAAKASFPETSMSLLGNADGDELEAESLIKSKLKWQKPKKTERKKAANQDLDMEQELIGILEKTLSPDQNELKAATEFLEQAAKADLVAFLRTLSDILKARAANPIVRVAAGLQLKNQIAWKDPAKKDIFTQKWFAIPEEARQIIKTNVLEALGTEGQRPSTAAQCVAHIAIIELPRGVWPRLIPDLVDNVCKEGVPDSLKAACLESIGYICQDIQPAVLAEVSNSILTAIVNGMRLPDENIRLAAVNALLNSLEFTQNNFAVESERNVIMTVTCEATTSNNTQVRVVALQCLVRIISLYYEYMEVYMASALLPITLEAMNSDTSELVLQGIEFWSTVCETELDLAINASEAAELERPALADQSRYYAKGALKYVLPIVLETLTKQDECDEDEWTPAKGAGVCLSLFAECTEDAIVEYVVPFVTQNIGNGDWRYREAAVMAFGSILEGEEQRIALFWAFIFWLLSKRTQ